MFIVEIRIFNVYDKADIRRGKIGHHIYSVLLIDIRLNKCRCPILPRRISAYY